MGSSEWRRSLGSFGVWVSGTAVHHHIDGAELAERVEALGIPALWVGGGNLDPAELAQRRAMLAATQHLVVATGIASIWAWEPRQLYDEAVAIDDEFPGRFLLGLGVSHAPLVNKLGMDYRRPVSKMLQFLDGLDQAAATSAGRQIDRVLAALGNKMLEISRDRSVGAHPYLVTPEHSELARRVLGSEPLLAPEQTVVLVEDPSVARRRAREFLSTYLVLPNYQASLRRAGFEEADLSGGGSDHLVDAVVPWGNEASVAARVAEHLTAGADHICIQALGEGGAVDLGGLQGLAAELRSLSTT